MNMQWLIVGSALALLGAVPVVMPETVAQTPGSRAKTPTSQPKPTVPRLSAKELDAIVAAHDWPIERSDSRKGRGFVMEHGSVPRAAARAVFRSFMARNGVQGEATKDRDWASREPKAGFLYGPKKEVPGSPRLCVLDAVSWKFTGQLDDDPKAGRVAAKRQALQAIEASALEFLERLRPGN